MDLRTHGIGAQILREVGDAHVKLMGRPRRMPSMAGYGLRSRPHHQRRQGIRKARKTMQYANKGQNREISGVGLHIGIVQARFNQDITDALADACRTALLDLGVDEDNITLVQVPGALEVPLALAALAERTEFYALIALGCIIRGETYHFELVANESGAGVTMSLTTVSRLPTLSYHRRPDWPSPARPKRGVMLPTWRWKWPSCWPI